MAPSASLKRVQLALAVEAEGAPVFGDRPYQSTLTVPDVYSGEFTLPSLNAYNLQTHLGEMARIAFVIFLVASTTNLSGSVLRIQLESTSSPKLPLNSGGMYVAWNTQTTTTWCRVENLSAGDVIVQYVIGGYR